MRYVGLDVHYRSSTYCDSSIVEECGTTESQIMSRARGGGERKRLADGSLGLSYGRRVSIG
jgi:hypothetical protein